MLAHNPRVIYRGPYFGFGTNQNKAAWALGLSLTTISIVVTSIGSNGLRACLDDYTDCQNSLYAKGKVYPADEGPCYEQYIDTCQAPKWARMIIIGLLALIGAAACLSFCCCCSASPYHEEVEAGRWGIVTGTYHFPQGQPIFQETQPLVHGYPVHMQPSDHQVHWTSGSMQHNLDGVEMQQQQGGNHSAAPVHPNLVSHNDASSQGGHTSIHNSVSANPNEAHSTTPNEAHNSVSLNPNEAHSTAVAQGPSSHPPPLPTYTAYVQHYGGN